MIYTVTLNPAIDKTVVIPGLTAGAVNRVESIREDAGGKGINVSKCLKVLGAQSVAAMLLGGTGGTHLADLVAAEGLVTLSAPARGQTRTNLKIIDPVSGKNTDINEPGPRVETETLQGLLTALQKKVLPGDIVVLSGSLPHGAPEDTYKTWVEALKALGVRVFLDADGACMVCGLQGQPYLVKPNEIELARVLGRPMDTQEELLAGGRQLLALGIGCVVISLGGEGALFLWEDACYRAKGLQVPVKSTVGAGDSVVAAMAYALERDLPKQEQIRLAMAMGAASVMQSGTQAPEESLVRTLAQQVEFERI